MRLDQPFLQLPISFSAETLADEIRALPPSAWQPHPTGFVGNEAVPLITPGGALTDGFEGPMAPTPSLRACPYIMEIMAELGCVWGRSRLMGLAPGREVPPHVDSHYYWRTHHRLHIPIITNPGVSFNCGDETVHMAAGECWMFDSFRFHDVQNKGSEQRIHLVIDTVGGGRLFELIEAAKNGAAADGATTLRPGQRSGDGLAFEQVNTPMVMTPWEIRCHLGLIAEHAVPDPLLDKVMSRMDRLVDAWTAAWARFGADAEGLPAYRQLLATTRLDLDRLGGSELTLDNQVPLYHVLDRLIFHKGVAAAKTAASGVPTAGNQRLAS